MEDKILERMLNNLIEEAGPIAIENMERKQEDAPEVEFSKEHEEKMKKIFAEARKEIESKSKNEKSIINQNEESVTKPKSNKVKIRRLIILAATLVLILGFMTTASRMEREFSEIFY